MKRVLITGALGFLGSNLVHYFTKTRNWNLYLWDKVTYAANWNNLYPLEKGRDYLFYEKDVVDPSLASFLRDNYIDLVIHLAAESMVDRAEINVAPFIQSNIVGTHNVVQSCLEAEIPLYYQSTDEVLGSHTPGGLAYWDELSPIDPQNLYAISKASAEMIVQGYDRSTNVWVYIARACNIYGPRQHREKFIPKAIEYSKAGKPFPLYRPGDQVRQWLYVEDYCKAVSTILDNGELGEIYNIAPTILEEKEGRTNLSILEQLYFPRQPEINFSDQRKIHDHTYRMSCDKLKQLGWKQTTSLYIGLTRTEEYYL